MATVGASEPGQIAAAANRAVQVADSSLPSGRPPGESRVGKYGVTQCHERQCEHWRGGAPGRGTGCHGC